MNDFDYDVLQKKRLGYGAKHKKGLRKGCTLPSDHLSEAEKKARNGEVKTYNLDLPMTWEDFKAMPKDLQETYIRNLQSRFNVGLSYISTDVFGMNRMTLPQHMSRNNIPFEARHRGGPMRAQDRYNWDVFLGQIWKSPVPIQRDEIETAKAIIEEMEKPEPVEAHKKNTDGFDLNHLIVEFTGDFDAENFLRYLSNFPMPQGRVCIRMEVTAE